MLYTVYALYAHLFLSRYFFIIISGAAFTRFQTMRLQKVFPEVLSQQLISYGSCQFPTLGFVVARFKEVQAFVAEPFWKLKGLFLIIADA